MADKLPTYQQLRAKPHALPPSSRARLWPLVVASLVLLHILSSSQILLRPHHPPHHVPQHARQVLRECAALKMLPGPPASFSTRSKSDRFVPGTKAQHIYNATIWTGMKDGNEGRSRGTYW